MYLIDTSVWIEILKKTDKGEAIEKKLSEVPYFTPAVCLAELSKWAYLNNLDSKDLIQTAEVASGDILATTRSSEERAGNFWVKINKETVQKGKTVGLIDCIIAAIAEENDLTVLTKDKHFGLFEQIKKELL